MEFRRQLITAQVGLLAVIAVTALTTIVALRKTSTRGNDAYDQLARDLKLRDHVRQSAQLVTDATRRYLIEGTAVQRSRLAQLQRELDPGVDRLASRAVALEAPNSDSLERDVDRYVAWLSATASERVPISDFERTLEARTTDLDKHLQAFGDAARGSGTATIAKANRLAHRAQLGVLVTSSLGIAMALMLGSMALRKYESQLRRVRAATAVANRMAAAHKQLVEVASHDLRAPLNTIADTASCLLDGESRDTERSHIERITSATDRMKHQLDDLSDIARLESGQIELYYERFNTRTIMDACVEMFFARANARGVRLESTCRDTLLLRADRERIIQVLTNLIRTALSFSGKDSRVTLNATTESSGVRFAVTYSGPGISPDERAQLFERGKQGAGLALYISKRLVEAHHGQIGVESEPGTGSTFWFIIPA